MIFVVIGLPLLPAEPPVADLLDVLAKAEAAVPGFINTSPAGGGAPPDPDGGPVCMGAATVGASVKAGDVAAATVVDTAPAAPKGAPSCFCAPRGPPWTAAGPN